MRDIVNVFRKSESVRGFGAHPPRPNHAEGVYEIKAKPCMESTTCCGMESSRSDAWHQSEGEIHAGA